MKLSDYVAWFLEKEKIKYVFGYQGGSITHLIESISSTSVKYIQNYNEQGSAMAADGYSRISGEKMGVAIASNGPGATNLITGIANSYCDSVATVFITGQVHTWAMKGNSGVRQESFQEIDILSMLKPITKYAVTIMDKNDIRYELEKAIYIANEGRKGPVLIDIPVDVQGLQIDENDLKGYIPEEKKFNKEYDLQVIYKALNEAKRPMILVGGGVTDVNSKIAIRTFCENNSIPVVCSLQGLDVINHDNKSFMGYIGSYGNRYANIALQNADVLLVLGSRLDMRQTGKNREGFVSNAKIIHVDIDKTELNHTVKEDVSICCDVNAFIKEFVTDNLNNPYCRQWRDIIENWKERYTEDLAPNRYVSKIGSLLNDNVIATSDVGQNQMWVAQSFRVKGENNRILNSGGLGAMGYSLPAAIGSYYASPDKTIISFNGDGGIQMNIQELGVIGHLQLPIKIFVFNNHALGLIREVHEKYYNSNYVGSVEGFSQPDFEILAKAYGIGYVRISEIDEIDNIKDKLEDKAPYIFDIVFDEDTYVRPELLGMDTIDMQSPKLSEEEINIIRAEVNMNEYKM